MAISLRKRLFSRLLPARKEQNHSGARSMRRWNAMVESGSNASGVAAAVSEGCGAVMASAIFSPDAGSTNWICSGNSPNCAKSPVYPMAFNNKKLFALNSLTNSGQSCPNAAHAMVAQRVICSSTPQPIRWLRLHPVCLIGSGCSCRTCLSTERLWGRRSRCSCCRSCCRP